MKRYTTEQPRFAGFALVAAASLEPGAGDAAHHAVVSNFSVGR